MLPFYNVYIAPFLLTSMAVAEFVTKHGQGIIRMFHMESLESNSVVPASERF